MTDDIPAVFDRLEPGDKIRVHDYVIYSFPADPTPPALSGLRFDYVPDATIGTVPNPAATLVFVRPIVAVLDILDMLQGDKCVCGDHKPRGRSHCSPCYYALPADAAKHLYRRFRSGYEQAFLMSLLYLIKAGRTDPDKIRAAVPKPKAEHQAIRDAVRKGATE